jgi:hypothetical protein
MYDFSSMSGRMMNGTTGLHPSLGTRHKISPGALLRRFEQWQEQQERLERHRMTKAA